MFNNEKKTYCHVTKQKLFCVKLSTRLTLNMSSVQNKYENVKYFFLALIIF